MSKYLFFIPPVFFIVKNFSSIVSFVKNFRTNVPIYREIYRTASLKTLIEFCIFKARFTASKHLETGLLSSDTKTHNLIYYDGSTRYSVRFPKKRGPCPFSQVTTYFNALYNAHNVTERIREFAGPSHNFHGIPTTPQMLGYDNLTFTFRNGLCDTYLADDVINIKFALQHPERCP